MSNSAGDTSATIVTSIWQQALDAAQDIWIVTNAAAQIVEANAKFCSIAKRPRDSVLGTLITEYIAREDKTFWSRALRSIVVNRRVERITITLKSTAGDSHIFEIIGTPLIRSGEVTAIAFSGRDITEEAVLEQKLWDTLDERNRTLDFSLRTSLGLVKGYVHTLENSDRMSPDQRRRYMRVVLDEMEHLSRAIENLLDCRRLEDNTYDLTADVTDLKEVITMAVAEYHDEASRREIDIRISIPEGMAPIYLPSEAVHRILTNLVENAIIHTLHNGRIDIDFMDNEDYVDIIVQDYGAGIPEADLPYIFEKYYRGGSANYMAQGTGLGLAITRMLVSALGGRIWAVSEVGKGARFSVMLPRRTGLSTPESAEAPNEVNVSANGPETLVSLGSEGK